MRDVKVPRSVHSHNDEIRPVPLWDALTHGFLYVEPDVIHKDGALCIGHNEDDLVPGDTLDSLYLDPLRRLLKALYPDSQPGQARGVYPNAPKESLYLVIDFKFPGQE